MTKRYNPQERIGVNAIEEILLIDFEWIFREQQTVDVGIDALVEQSESGEPKGKFIALQIKTGKSHFHKSKEGLIYYMSDVHYNYWLNFDMPVLLIAHLPNEKKTYWQEITRHNIERTKTSWKLLLPKDNILNKAFKPHLRKLLTLNKRNYTTLNILQGNPIKESTIFHLAEKSSCIADANDAIERIGKIMNELELKTNESGLRFNYFNEIGQSFKSPEVFAAIWSFSKNLILFSKRIENEIEIFTDMFAQGIFGYQMLVNSNREFRKQSSFIYPTVETLRTLPQIIDNANLDIGTLKSSIKALPNDYSSLNEAKTIFTNMVSHMIKENETAKKMIISLLDSLK